VKKLLIIDDSVSDRRIYKRYLARAGLEIVESSTAREGVIACRAHEPACVILDFRLPDMDGLRTMAELRGFYEGPIIFISGNPETTTMSQAFRTGAVTYLSKDLLDGERLSSAVKSVLT
jgi:CheY-like chemotaxis protein